MAAPETNLSPIAQDDERRLTRLDLLNAAYKFVAARDWPDGYGVHDVLDIARFLDTEET